jgi:hypothetical protein
MPLLFLIQYQFGSAGHKFINGMVVLYYFITGTLTCAFFLIYYKLLLPLLFKKKYIRFAILVLMFAILWDFYLRGMDWFIRLPIFPDMFPPVSMPDTELKKILRQNLNITITHIISLSAVGFFVKTFRDEANILKLKEQKSRLELQQLRMQLQPHFLFNTLNNIYSLSLHQSAKTSTSIAQLSEILRYVIYDCSNDKIPLWKELRFIDNYIKLEQIRYDDADVSFHFQGNDQSIFIEPLLFIPIIENSFKHGIHKNENGWIKIVLIVFENELVLTAKNNKAPEPEAGNNQKGIGLQSVRKQLELLYPSKHQFLVKETDSQFEVYLNLYM